MSDEENLPFDENPFSSSDGVLVVDNDGKILMMNSVMKELWSMPKELSESKEVSEVIKHIVKESIDPVPIIEGASKVLGLKSTILKSEILLKNSKVVSVHTFPMTGSDYKIHGRIWYTRDVTEEKKIEDLRNLQNLMMENLAEGVVMVKDRDGSIVYTNPCFNRMFGYLPGELLHKHISIINVPAENGLQEKSEEISKILRKKGYWSGVVKNIKKSGDHVWSEVRVSSVNHSQYGKVWVSLQNDITSKVREDKERRFLSKQFYLLFENSLVPMMLITTDGGVLMANKEACKLFGRSEKELIKIGRKGLVNHMDKRFERLVEIRKKTGSFRGEFTVIHKDGHLIEVEGVSKVFIDDDGEEHSHIILRDKSL